MMQNRGIGFGGMANPTTPPMPPRGFGTRVTDLFKDQSKFADALTGLALLSGTPSSRAMGIRDALAPVSSSTSKSVGTLYNVKDRSTGQFTGEQVYATDRQRIEQISKNTNLELVEVGEQLGTDFGKTEEGFIRVMGENGYPIQFAIPGSNAEKEIITDINRAEGVMFTAAQQIDKAEINRDIILQDLDDKNTSGGYLYDKELLLPINADVREAVANLKINNFIDTLQAMRAASKTGGAVGQVSNIELEELKNATSPLDPRQNNFRDRVIQNVNYMIGANERMINAAKRDIETSRAQLSEQTVGKIKVNVPQAYDDEFISKSLTDIEQQE